MRVIVALGGNAIARRGEIITVAHQLDNLRLVSAKLKALAEDHELVITHGNGPQVGLLALQNAAYPDVAAYPLDVLGAESQGMIGYFIEIEMRHVLPPEQKLTTVLTLVEVSRQDPAFANPTKFIGPIYSQAEADVLSAQRGWTFKLDGAATRRVVPSPFPQRVVQIDSVMQLLKAKHIVICAGGGGIPMARDHDGHLVGVEAVVDKDASSAVLATAINADLFIMATDAEAVYLDWGTSTQQAIKWISTGALGQFDFAAGSMGPKVAAAIAFAEVSGGRAVIGKIDDMDRILAGDAGTVIEAKDGPTEFYLPHG
jgi:carbamate kinase